ncbi:MAG: DnaK suppressor protein [Candidatus Pelagisphaera sp.]|jgi:DnaK suppressor protein
MTPDQLAKIRSIIDERINEIETFLAQEDPESKPVAPDVAIGRLSRLDSMQAQQMILAQQRRLREELEHLQSALERIGKGTYGNCAYCLSPIAYERLEAMPDAVVCISCAR